MVSAPAPATMTLSCCISEQWLLCSLLMRKDNMWLSPHLGFHGLPFPPPEIEFRPLLWDLLSIGSGMFKGNRWCHFFIGEGVGQQLYSFIQDFVSRPLLSLSSTWYEQLWWYKGSAGVPHRVSSNMVTWSRPRVCDSSGLEMRHNFQLAIREKSSISSNCLSTNTIN